MWADLQRRGAESVNISPNPEADCLDIEVYFTPPRSVRQYATWQIILSSLCAIGITLAALCPPQDGTNG